MDRMLNVVIECRAPMCYKCRNTGQGRKKCEVPEEKVEETQEISHQAMEQDEKKQNER